MKRTNVIHPLAALFVAVMLAGCSSPSSASEKEEGAALVLYSERLAAQGQGPDSRALTLDGLFYETTNGRVTLPVRLTVKPQSNRLESQTTMPDGRVVTVSVKPDGKDFNVRLSAQPDADIVKWGLAVRAGDNEYFTGLMERVVDGPQQASWATEHHRRHESAGTEGGNDP